MPPRLMGRVPTWLGLPFTQHNPVLSSDWQACHKERSHESRTVTGPTISRCVPESHRTLPRSPSRCRLRRAYPTEKAIRIGGFCTMDETKTNDGRLRPRRPDESVP